MSDSLRPEEAEGQVPATEQSPNGSADVVDSKLEEGESTESGAVETPEETAEETPAGGAAAEGAPAEEIDEEIDDGLAEAEAAWEDDDDQLDADVDVEPLEELVEEEAEEKETVKSEWYILKVQVNRESSIADALRRSVMINDKEEFFSEIVVPTEDVVEFTKSGKRRTVKKKLYPGYIMVNMILNDDTWFLVRDTSGIGDFTGSAGKPTPMNPEEVDRIVKPEQEEGEVDEDAEVRVAIPFRPDDRVRVKEGYFQNFEGVVESIDETNGRVTVIINIFGRSTPVDMQHWQMESL
jgi:transcriptional antiterminator NusG